MITFTITFHGPFHIGTGAADCGLDRTVDRRHLLPASSLKGLMRAEASEVLGVDEHLVNDIFGRAGRAGAWWWQDAEVAPSTIGRAARIRIDERGIAREGFLALGEHVWADSATFAVDALRTLDPKERGRHTTVLRAAARSVTGLGGARRRGEGWVSINDDLGPWTSDDTDVLLACRGEA